VLLAACGVAVCLPALSASAATTGPIGGAVARQDVFDRTITVTGWAYDTTASARSVEVSIYVDGRWAGRVWADLASPSFDTSRHITGNHAFRFTRSWSPTATTVSVYRTGTRIVLAKRAVSHYQPPAGTRIVTVAKRYVGAAPYVEGGASPKGFDCSGYTQYAYAQAHVHALPHNAEGQRTMAGMRRISAASAQPGDLVFYMSGGTAYHVAIYAGHGMQYAAATVRDGIRYQHVWSSAVQYRTDWH
jgi:cell wall-associated NlpC family hydrolase